MTKFETNFFRPIVGILMAGAVMFAVVNLFQLISLTWNGQYNILIAMFAAGEGWLSRRVLTRTNWAAGHNTRLRVSEVIFFFLILQGCSQLFDKQWFFGDPDTSIPIFIGVFVATVIGLCWLAGYETAGDLDLMGLPPAERDGDAPSGRLLKRFVAGAALILVASGIARVGVLQLLRPQSQITGLAFNTIAYFFLGVVLLGNVHYGSLRLNWQRQDQQIAPALTRRWLRISLIFLGVVALISFALPTSYTAGLLQVLGYGLGLVMSVFIYLIGLIVYGLGLLLSPLGALLQQDQQQQEQPPAQPPKLNLPQDTTTADFSWFEIVKAVGFWLLVIVLAIWLFRTFIWRNASISAFLSRITPLAWLFKAVGGFWQRLRRMGKAASKRMRDLNPIGKGGAPARPGAYRVRERNSMRDEVRAYYLGLLDRAAERGLARRPPETPFEYNKTLTPHVAEAGSDLSELTEAFVEASYSPRPPSAEQVAEAKARTERINNALAAKAAAEQAQTDAKKRSQPKDK